MNKASYAAAGILGMLLFLSMAFGQTLLKIYR